MFTTATGSHRNPAASAKEPQIIVDVYAPPDKLRVAGLNERDSRRVIGRLWRDPKKRDALLALFRLTTTGGGDVTIRVKPIG